jgi:hypothetical protein
MTNRLAVILGILILGAMAADFALNDGAALFFLSRKFLGLVDYLTFWR